MRKHERVPRSRTPEGSVSALKAVATSREKALRGVASLALAHGATSENLAIFMPKDRSKTPESSVSTMQDVVAGLEKALRDVAALALAYGATVERLRDFMSGNQIRDSEAGVQAMRERVRMSSPPQGVAESHQDTKQPPLVNTRPAKRPKCALYWGGVGVGKTTMRRERCAEGFVHIDASEIFAELSGRSFGTFPGPFEAELDEVGNRIAKEAIGARRDIAVEIIGDSADMTKSIADGLHSIGYDVESIVLALDPDEAYMRCRHASETDPTYVSAYFTQHFHHRWILAAIGESNKCRV